MSPADVQKLWNYCNVLRGDGMSYLLARGVQESGDHLEQLTRLLFLKVFKERTKPRKVYEGPIPKKYNCWGSGAAMTLCVSIRA